MDTIAVALLSVWIGFAAALQVRIQTKIDNRATLGGFGKKRLVGRLIFMAVGIGGMLGVASLIGSVEQFRGPAFPIGCAAGVAAYWAFARPLNTTGAGAHSF